MTYQEVQDRLTKVETALTALSSGNYSNIPSFDVAGTTAQLQELKEQLETQLQILAEEETGTVSTDDAMEAERLAKKGVNVQLTKEEEAVTSFDINETKAIGKEVGKALAMALRELGDEVASMKLKNVQEGSFRIECTYKGAGGAEYDFYISEDTLYLSDYSANKEVADVGVKPSGEAIVNKDVVKDSLLTHFKSMAEGMSDQEFADAQEKERLDKHPEKKTIEKIQAMMAKEKTLREDWGSSDQAAMNQSIHRELGEPEQFPGLSQIMDAAEGAVDFYWDDWEEYETDREGLVMYAAQRYANSMFPDFMAGMRKMLEPVDEAMDFNDPVLVKLRAAAEKVKGEKNKQAALPLELSPAKQLMLAKLKRKRAEVMRDMEQEAEPEGGPIADKYGDMLNKIDDAIAKLKGEKVYENSNPVTIEDFNKVVAAVKASNQPATVMFVPKWNEIEIIVGQEAPDPLIDAIHNEVSKLGLDRNAVSMAGDSSSYSRREYEAIERINGGHKDYYRFEETANEEKSFSDYSNNELATYCKNNPKDKAAADELHKRSQNLKDLSRTDVNEAPEGMYYITVSVRDARKALDILDDMYRKQFVIDGSNRYYFSNPEIAYDAFMDFGAHGIEIEDTNVDDDMLQEASVASVQKKYDAHVTKMKELAKEYTKAEGDKKDKIKDQLKDMTAEKKKLEKDLEKAVAGTGKDQEVADIDETSCNRKRKMNESISKKRLKSLIESAYIEVLREEEGAVLATGTQELLQKFPTLERAIVNFLTEDHEQFIEAIDWIAPKPTTFKVRLKNGQSFILKWLGKGFEAQIQGKRYYINKVSEFQQALDKLNELLKHAPVQSAEEPAADAASDGGDFGSGGDGGDFPGEEGGDIDAGDEGGAEEEIEFEEPGEEPEA